MREEEHLRELEKAQEAEMAQLQAEEEARLMRKLERDIYGHSSDEDDDENETSATVRDRIRGQAQSKGTAVGGAKAAVGEDDEEEEEDGESTFSALNRIANVRTLSELERQRLARLQSEFANEPEWGNHDANQHVSYKRNSSSSGGSITSFKASKGVSSKSSNSNLNASSKPVASNQQQLRRVRSKLSDVMSRKGQFSEVQDT